MSTKTQRFQNTDGTHLGQAFGGSSESMKEFTRLEQFAKLQKPPAVKFKDLEAAVTSKITFNILPMKVRADFFPLTEASVLTYVTLQFENKDMQFQDKMGVEKATINIFGRITTMTRRIVQTFEDTVTVDCAQEMLQAYAKRSSIYQKADSAAARDLPAECGGEGYCGREHEQLRTALNVPHLDSEKLSPAPSCWPT